MDGILMFKKIISTVLISLFLNLNQANALMNRYMFRVTSSATSNYTWVSPSGGFAFCAGGDGTAKCWGTNIHDGVTAVTSYIPVSIGGTNNSGIVTSSVAPSYQCILLSANGGTLKCAASSVNGGYLGNGTSSTSPTYINVTNGTGVTSVSTGNTHACAIFSGVPKCWGPANTSGALGNNSTTQASTSPTAITGLASATIIKASNNTTCAIDTAGAVKCWGNNTRGQIGDGTSAGPRLTPTQVVGITSGATDVSLDTINNFWACAVVRSQVKCWGSNPGYGLGDGINTASNTPVTVSGITNAVKVTVGSNHACALLSDGSLKCWGKNVNGQLGDGSTLTALSPVTSVLNGSKISDVSAQFNTTCAIFNPEKKPKCVGYNLYGALGLGATDTVAHPVWTPPTGL